MILHMNYRVAVKNLKLTQLLQMSFLISGSRKCSRCRLPISMYSQGDKFRTRHQRGWYKVPSAETQVDSSTQLILLRNLD